LKPHAAGINEEKRVLVEAFDNAQVMHIGSVMVKYKNANG